MNVGYVGNVGSGMCVSYICMEGCLGLRHVGSVGNVSFKWCVRVYVYAFGSCLFLMVSIAISATMSAGILVLFKPFIGFIYI